MVEIKFNDLIPLHFFCCGDFFTIQENFDCSLFKKKITKLVRNIIHIKTPKWGRHTISLLTFLDLWQLPKFSRACPIPTNFVLIELVFLMDEGHFQLLHVLMSLIGTFWQMISQPRTCWLDSKFIMSLTWLFGQPNRLQVEDRIKGQIRNWD